MALKNGDTLDFSLTKELREFVLGHVGPYMSPDLHKRMGFGVLNKDGYGYTLSVEEMGAFMEAVSKALGDAASEETSELFEDLYDTIRAAANKVVDMDAINEIIPQDLPQDLIEELGEALRNTDIESVDDVEEVVRQFRDKYALRKLEVLGGISIMQGEFLLERNWQEPDGPVRLNGTLGIEDVGGAMLFQDARVLLSTLAEMGEFGMTARDNLKLNVVRRLVERLPSYASSKGVLLETEHGRFRSEEDVLEVLSTRLTCQYAGLMDEEGKKLTLSSKGAELLDDSRAGELYVCLFDSFFQEIDIAARDSFIDWEMLQYVVPYILYRIDQLADEWYEICGEDVQALLPGFCLTELLDNAEEEGIALDDVSFWNLAVRLLNSRVLAPLWAFGLIHCDYSSTVDEEGDRMFLICVRKTPLYDRFLSFHIPENDDIDE
jgi:hypothetical protein